MLRDSVVVVRTRPRAIPLAKITVRKSAHGFCFLSHDAYGAPLGGPSGRQSSFTKIFVIDVIMVAVFRAERWLNTSLYHARGYTITLVYLNWATLNSSLNLILYCWKIVEGRQTVKDTIRQLLCFVFRVSLCRPIWWKVNESLRLGF